MTWCLSAAEMTHVIAGSVDVLFAVFSGQVAATAYIARFLAPTFVGNTLGGMVLCGCPQSCAGGRGFLRKSDRSRR